MKKILLFAIGCVALGMMGSFHVNKKEHVYQNQVDSTGILLDTFDNSVVLYYGDNGYPAGYKSAVFTPVCHSGECWPVRIDLYWNLAGNYDKFILPDTQLLTKADHIPFTPADYRLLDNILGNKQSELPRYAYDDLTVKPTDGQKVDGVSGATITGLKGHYVPQALFSSHTLWHLVNLEATHNALVKYTRAHVFKHYPVSYYINQPDPGCQALAIRFFAHQHQMDETALLLELADSGSVELVQFSIELLPASAFEQKYVREQLVQYYNATTSPKIHTAILTQWEKYGIDTTEAHVIVDQLGQNYSTIKTEMTLLANCPLWTEAIYQNLLTLVENEHNLKRKETIYSLIAGRQSSFSKAVKKRFKQIGKAEELTCK